MSLCKSVISFEPAYMAHITSVMLSALYVQDFIQEKVCRVNLGYDTKICDALLLTKNSNNAYPTELKEVQKLTAIVLMVKTIIENAFPLFLVFLMGPWSDKYGRKLPLLIVISGFLTANSMLAFFSYGKSESPTGAGAGAWTVALSVSIAVSATGSQNCFMMAAFSYVIESVSVPKMSVRMGITHSCFLLSLFIGFGGGGLLSRRGFTKFNIFTLSLCLEAFAFLYLLIMMKNTRPDPETVNQQSYFQIFKELFDFTHIKDAVNSIFKQRVGNERKKLWLLLLAHSCSMMPMFGEFNVYYLYVQKTFHWDVQDFGLYVSYKTAVGFLSNFFTTFLLVYLLGFTDPINGIIASLSRVAANILISFASTPQMLYMGPLVAILSGPAFTVPRTQISKLVASNELGKVNSFIGSLECVTFLIASPIYALSYYILQETFPSGIFLISAALSFPQMCVYWWIYKHPKSDDHLD